MDETGFGQKLDHLKTVLDVTDGEIGNHVGVVASLVCRWRKGQRTLDRFDNAHMVRQLAVFFIERAAFLRRHARLAEILSLDETAVDVKNQACIDALVAYLYDGRIAGTGKKTPAGGVSLLYLDEDGYLSLLRQNGVTKSQRDYRKRKFREALQSEQLMNTKQAVRMALQLRLEKLGS